MRTYTREQVEQVVEAYAQSLRDGPEMGESVERLGGARDVLRRLDALPDADSGEGLPGECGNCGKPGAVCRPCRVELDICDMPDALSNPPAVPESSPTRSIAQGIADMTRHLPILPGVVPCDVKLAPRPRATTPTPEVPALKDEPHYRCADPDCEAPERPECGHVLTGRPPGSLRATCRKAPHGDDVPHRWDEEPGTMSPGPTAPEVVWEGDGVRVLADGKWEFVSGGTYHEGFNALARALAEVSSELREERANLHKIDRDRCDTINFLTREGVRERMKSHEDRLKLAESMHARAVSELLRHTREACDCDSNENCLRSARENIRALPLEEP